MVFWFIGRRSANDSWSYVSLDFFALVYFYLKWSAPGAQHRTMHFILMCAYAVSTLFIGFQLGVLAFTKEGGLADYWLIFWAWNLFSNVVFAFALVFLTVYALLRRRAAKDPEKWRDDVKTWFDRKK